jgi:hypothetical protein
MAGDRSGLKKAAAPLEATTALPISVLPQTCGRRMPARVRRMNRAPDRCPALLRIHLALRRTWL